MVAERNYALYGSDQSGYGVVWQIQDHSPMADHCRRNDTIPNELTNAIIAKSLQQRG